MNGLLVSMVVDATSSSPVVTIVQPTHSVRSAFLIFSSFGIFFNGSPNMAEINRRGGVFSEKQLLTRGTKKHTQSDWVGNNGDHMTVLVPG